MVGLCWPIFVLSCAMGAISCVDPEQDPNGANLEGLVEEFSRPYVEALFRAVYPTVQIRPWLQPRVYATESCANIFRSRSSVKSLYWRIGLAALKGMTAVQNPLRHLNEMNYGTIALQRNNLFAELVSDQVREWNRVDEISFSTKLHRYAQYRGNRRGSWHVDCCLRGWICEHPYSQLFQPFHLKSMGDDGPLERMRHEMDGARVWLYSRPSDLSEIASEKWTRRQVHCDLDMVDPDKVVAVEEEPSLSRFERLAAWWGAFGRADAWRRRPAARRAHAPLLHAVAHRRVTALREDLCITVFDVTWVEPGTEPPDGVDEFHFEY